MVAGLPKAGEKEIEWPGYLDEYEKLVLLTNTPKVVIDNDVFPNATLVTVDSARKYRFLLKSIQVLSDLNLSINKAYFSSDGGWFMDVFHLTDQFGSKLTDKRVISFIEETLEAVYTRKAVVRAGHTVLELSGTDRPGLLSEVFAVLADLQCSVADARVWTHSGRIAAVLLVFDDESAEPIDEDPYRLSCIKSRLRHIVCGRTEITSIAVSNTDRRLHQMLFADRDFERASSPPAAFVQSLVDRGYSFITVQCPDRPKLLFDTVCTLTDMEYVVFHGTVRTEGGQAYQEFYIRHSDGSPIMSEGERHRVMQCLQAAVERRAQGLRIELRTEERRGILSEVTRVFRENGLLVKRAEVSTKGQLVSNVFYITDTAGGVPSSEMVAAIQQRIGSGCLTVKEPALRTCDVFEAADSRAGAGVGLLRLGSLVLRNLYNWVLNLYNWGLIRSR